MKKILLCGAAVTFAAITPVHAADYTGAKERDNQALLSSARTIDDTRTTTAPAASPYQAPVTPPAPVAAPAPVQQPVEPAPRQDMATNFTGPYLGLDFGYGWAKLDGPTGAGDVSPDGIEGGGFAGYGYQFGLGDIDAYLGAEVGFEWSDADDTSAAGKFEKKDTYLATLRPGVVIDNTTLGYGIIGYANSRFKGGGDSDRIDGIVYGGGVEWALSKPLSLRAEYTFTDYSSNEFNGASFDGHDNAAKVGVVWRFTGI